MYMYRPLYMYRSAGQGLAKTRSGIKSKGGPGREGHGIEAVLPCVFEQPTGGDAWSAREGRHVVGRGITSLSRGHERDQLCLFVGHSLQSVVLGVEVRWFKMDVVGMGWSMEVGEGWGMVGGLQHAPSFPNPRISPLLRHARLLAGAAGTLL